MELDCHGPRGPTPVILWPLRRYCPPEVQCLGCSRHVQLCCIIYYKFVSNFITHSIYNGYRFPWTLVIFQVISSKQDGSQHKFSYRGFRWNCYLQMLSQSSIKGSTPSSSLTYLIGHSIKKGMRIKPCTHNSCPPVLFGGLNSKLAFNYSE